MSDQPTTATNLANQRKAALEFVGPRPEITKVVFSEEGSVGGSGLWAANAVLTVDGNEYQAILGLGIGATSWEPWQNPPPGTMRSTVTVVYSDGTTEVTLMTREEVTSDTDIRLASSHLPSELRYRTQAVDVLL